MKRYLALMILGLLAACGQGGGPSEPASEEAAEASAAAEMAAASYSYEVRLVFAPDTVELLAAQGERVTVSSNYFGIPREGSAAARKAEGDGQVILDQGALQVEPADQVVRIVSPVIDPVSLKDIEGEPMLLVNVFTARQTSPDNLIDCGIYDGSLAVATVRPILIECGLIETPGAPAESPQRQ